jgi:Ca2+-binding RTX toxin-like protein
MRGGEVVVVEKMTQLVGTDSNDILEGKTGQDTILGKKGDDILTGSSAGKRELLIDGGFESSIVSDKAWSHYKTVGGWKSSTEVEVWGKGFYGQTSDVVELDYDTSKTLSNIYQDVTTEAGVEYTFSFDYAKRSDSKLGSDTIEVWWNGVKVGSVDPTSTTWSRAEFKVVGTGGTDRIEFREQADGKDNDSYGGLIDNASLVASSDGDLIQGGSGNDEIAGNGGDDVIYGGAISTGKPHTVTLEDNDVIKAGDGNDTVYGNAGDDKLYGEAGDDTMSGGKGDDVMSGGEGNDKLTGDTGNDAMYGDAGNDSLTGGKGDDHIDGGKGDDILDGGSGDDTIADVYGNNTVKGGSGFDTLDFSEAQSGVSVDLSKKMAQGKGFATSFEGIEAVAGSAFGDKLRGGKNADTLDGNAGDDWLRGLGGADEMTGGEGRDTFAWERKDLGTGVDVITDFSKEDVLDLRGLIKGTKWSAADDIVAIKDDGTNAHVYVNVKGTFVEVAVLENFSGVSAEDMLHNGMILA